jgi:nicotinate-nucleotide pyrophosphorylase (carboxylating)
VSGPFQPPAAAVLRSVTLALEEDVLPLGDITAALLPPTISRAVFVSRQRGVVAGTACVLETCRQVDPGLRVDVIRHDGEQVAPGDTILTLDGAVRAGGGTNHRGSLSEGVLIKDNHLGSATIGDAVRRARELWPGRLLEVECDRIEQVAEALAAGATLVLCDNMHPDALARCVELVGAHPRGREGFVLVEASGGITLETVGDFAAAGADFVSVGALTHSAPILDVGLDLLAERTAGLD